MPQPYPKRCDAKAGAALVFVVLGTYGNTAALEWIAAHPEECVNARDVNGSSPLMVAASLNRVSMVSAILTHVEAQSNASELLKQVNTARCNAIDLAVYYGKWRAYEVLRNAGCTPTVAPLLLMRSCLNKAYLILAGLLISDHPDMWRSCAQELLDHAPRPKIAAWLSTRSQQSITLEKAIETGMLDIVQKLTTADTPVQQISIAPYITLFPNLDKNPEQLAVFEHLFAHKWMNPDEIVEVKDENGDRDIVWPLFLACEKNQMQLFQMLWRFLQPTPALLNRQRLRGTTCLWIAACNRHMDMVLELLNLGADPNVANIFGDNCLIPCCQRGSETMLELLLEAGTQLHVYNPNRDNAVLICCRNGRSTFLEILFKRMTAEELQRALAHSADIDGFVPLLACAELDQVECLKVCHKYGADLETRSADDNKVLPGATALHLATFYGRYNTVKTLHEMGANMSSQTTVGGYTALHLAIKQNHPMVVRYLLSQDVVRRHMHTLMDADGRLPEYYAHMSGNEALLEEFFTNHLVKCISQVFAAPESVEAQCARIMQAHGQSLGCFEYSDITNMNCGEGSSVLSHALLHGNRELARALVHMGANVHHPDDRNITPLFWARLLKLHETLALPEPGVEAVVQPATETIVAEQLARVQRASESSVQNKLLVNLATQSRGALAVPSSTPVPEFDPLFKMSSGYDLKVPDHSVQKLVVECRQRTTPILLMSFLEKLKQQKVFPDGKQVLEPLLWQCKVHLIRMIASGEDKLQPIHLLALYLYTGNVHIHRQVNTILSTTAPPDSTLVWWPFLQVLYQAIECIEPCPSQQEVYRAVDAEFNTTDYAVGQQMEWNTFSIASTQWKNANEMINRRRGIVFLITRHRTGRRISRYSKYPVDEEVVFLPGTRFRIVNHYKPSAICLAQANIRTTTFKIDDLDLQKAAKQYASIIVELVQV